VVRAFCRGDHASCPAWRFVAAAGRSVHPGDFTAWIGRGLRPGRTRPEEERASARAAEETPKKVGAFPIPGDLDRASL
jgi:hypothetical protein